MICLLSKSNAISGSGVLIDSIVCFFFGTNVELCVSFAMELGAEGVVFVPPDAAYGFRLFVEAQLHFRYGAEYDEFADVAMKKVARVAHQELFPIGEKRLDYAPNKWQNGLFKKFGNVAGACPFSLTLPPGPPPSKVVHGGLGMVGEPLGLTYQIVAFMSHEPNEDPLRK